MQVFFKSHDPQAAELLDLSQRRTMPIPMPADQDRMANAR